MVLATFKVAERTASAAAFLAFCSLVAYLKLNDAIVIQGFQTRHWKYKVYTSVVIVFLGLTAGMAEGLGTIK